MRGNSKRGQLTVFSRLVGGREAKIHTVASNELPLIQYRSQQQRNTSPSQRAEVPTSDDILAELFIMLAGMHRGKLRRCENYYPNSIIHIQNIFFVLSSKSSSKKNKGVLGEGTYGRVKLVETYTLMGISPYQTAKKLPRENVIKVIKFQNEAQRETFHREVEILRRVHGDEKVHEIILCNKGTTKGYIVMPRARGITLKRCIDKRKINSVNVAETCLGVANSLLVMKEKGVVHFDLKLNNILFNGIEATIVDFGLSRLLDDSGRVSFQKPSGTPFYMAPELFKNEGYLTAAVDVYSLGVTFAVLLMSCANSSYEQVQILHQNHDDQYKSRESVEDRYENKCATTHELLNQLEAQTFRFPSTQMQFLVNLTRSMLALEPHERITIEQVVEELSGLFNHELAGLRR